MTPLVFKSGLPYMPIRLYTDDGWENIPHLVLTSDEEWNPSILDSDIHDNTDEWFDAILNMNDEFTSSLFNDFGSYCRQHIVNSSQLQDQDLESFIVSPTMMLEIHEQELQSEERNYESLCPLFAWLPADKIKCTFEATTKYAHIPMSTILCKHYKSPFPAMNVHCRQEAIATDTLYDAVDNVSTSAQIFIGGESFVTDVYGMKTYKQFVNTLVDVI